MSDTEAKPTLEEMEGYLVDEMAHAEMRIALTVNPYRDDDKADLAMLRAIRAALTGQSGQKGPVVTMEQIGEAIVQDFEISDMVDFLRSIGVEVASDGRADGPDGKEG